MFQALCPSHGLWIIFTIIHSINQFRYTLKTTAPLLCELKILLSCDRIDIKNCNASSARLIGHIPKYASVSAYMRDVLHWLPVSQRILYRISALVWRSVTGCAPSYL